MHKRGVAVLLSAVITVNTLPIGTVVSYADEVKQENSVDQELLESRGYTAERTLDLNLTIPNDEILGTVEGISSDNKINYTTYFSKEEFYHSWNLDKYLFDQLGKTEIKIKPKSGYRWYYELSEFSLEDKLALVEDKTISLNTGEIIGNIGNEYEKYGIENTMTILPIDSGNWITKHEKDISGNIKIAFTESQNAQKITLEKSDNGTIEPVEEVKDDLYIKTEDNGDRTTLIDNGSKYKFKLIPKDDDYKVQSVTLTMYDENGNTEETRIIPEEEYQDNIVEVGAGEYKHAKLEVKFSNKIVTKDFKVNITGDKSIKINDKEVSNGSNVTLSKDDDEQYYKFTITSDNKDKYIKSVKLEYDNLDKDKNGQYIIDKSKCQSDNLNINIELEDKKDTEIVVLGNTKVPYSREEQELKYNVIDKDTKEIIKENQVAIKAKEVGTYNFKVEFSGNEKYNPTSAEGTFEIYDAREEASVEIEGLGNIESIDTITRVYNNENQEVNYSIVGKYGKVIETGQATFTSDILGINLPTKAKNVGTYKLKIEFNGNDTYKPLKIEKELEITKFKPSVKVGNISIPYSGEKIKTPVEVTYNAGYINVYTGVNLNLGAEVNIDLNLGDDLIGKTISDIFNNLGASTIGDLKKILKDSEGLLSGLDVNVEDIIKALDYIPEDFKVNFGAPSKTGAYISTAIVLDQNAEVAVGVGSLHIYRQQKNVVFTENSLKDKEVITLEQVDDYKHEAYYEGTDTKAKIVYSGITAKGEMYFSVDKPTTEGVYVATAYSYDDPQYSVGLAMRTFTIIKEFKNVEFTPESLEDKAVIKVGTNYKHEAKIEGTDKNALIKYTGITLSGKKYSSTERPKEAGTYMATAYSPEDDKYVTGLGIRTFTIIREQKDVVFTDDSLADKSLVKVGQDYNHKAIYKDTDKEAKIMYSGVAVSGKLYFSAQKPTEEGIYVATAYAYDDTQYTVGLAMRTFSISKLTTKVEVKNDTKVYDGKEFKPEVVVTNRFGEVVENPNLKYTYYSGTTKLESAPTKAGNYKLVVTFMGDEQHIKSFATKNFTIEKAKLVINIDNAVKGKGFNDPTFTYSLEGLAENDNIEFDLVREDGEEVGEYEISVVDKVLENYNYTVNKGILTINPLSSILNSIPIIIAKDRIIKVGDTFNPKEGVTAYDKEDKDITDKIEVITNTVDTSIADTYKVTYKVTDSKGATATKTIKVTVEKNDDIVNPSPNPVPPIISPIPPIINTIEFSDIKGHWAAPDIKSFVSKGYIKGYEDKTFRPNKAITRAEFVKIVNKVYNFTAKGEENFKDVSKGEWFYDDISIALKAGYINGRSKDVFAPNDKITREEAMMILTNIAKNKDENLDKSSNFKDGNNISEWAKTAVEGAIEARYIKGYDDNTIRAKSQMTRAEAVVMLNRIQ